jgi:hypothetical protein
MTSPVDPGAGRVVHAALLRQLCERLESAHALTVAAQEALSRADAGGIDDARARLETVLTEFKVLCEEYDRLGAPAPSLVPALAAEERALEAAAARLARASAVAGGVLERMVHVTRRVLDLMALAKEGTYLPSGRAPELAPRGLRLQERA